MLFFPRQYAKREHRERLSGRLASIGKVSCGVQVRAIPPRAFYDLRDDLSMLCAEVRRKMQNGADFSGELTSIEASLNTFRQVTEKFCGKDGEREYAAYRAGDLWEDANGND